MSTRIYYTKPSITELEVKYATDAAANGWGEKCYAYIDEFEKRFKTYVGADYAIATSSCTGALHMGLAALSLGPGDEVIMADINWIASAAPITYLGATPVFVDILPDTWCLDPEKVEEAINDKTKAILAVHLYGNVCDMERLLALGEKYGVPVIEDAAESIGSCWRNQHTGTLGTFGVFSFHGTKTLTTGEGGMLVTNDGALYENVLTLSNHGRSSSSMQFRPDVIGYKYKMSNIQAALGCAQLERIDGLVARKREIFHHYHDRLKHIKGLRMNPEPDGTVNGYWMPALIYDEDTWVSRDRLLTAFRDANIDARVFFWPLSTLDMFEDKPNNRQARYVCERAINLPSYHDMTREDMDRVVDVIAGMLERM